MSQPDFDAWPALIYGTAWKKDATAALTQQAIAAGFRAIDTANQPQHYHEGGVGEGIAAALAGAKLVREDLFVQSKFSPLVAQGTEVPYERDAPVEEQVEQSLQSSLQHLGATWLDAWLLHAPENPRHMGEADWRAWRQMEAVYRRGDVRRIGVSNVGGSHLKDLLTDASVPPMAVQNRCFARTGWDRDVRQLCARHGIAYQGFSLLTANPAVVGHAEVRRLADRYGIAVPQLIFAFARHAGIIPLTGTTDTQHMTDDLASLSVGLDTPTVETLEGLAGG